MEITKAKIKEIYQKHKQGKSFRELAKEYDTYHYIISAIVKTYEAFLDELKQKEKLKKELNELKSTFRKYIIFSFIAGLIFGLLARLLTKIILGV